MTAIIFTLFFVFFVGTSVVPFLVNSKKTSFITMISLFWIVGFGALGLQMFYYVILNIPWNILYIILPWVIPFILSIRKLQSESFTIPKFKGNIIEKILLALILGLFLFTGIESIIRPLHTWDGWSSWLLRSKVYYYDKTVSPSYFHYALDEYPPVVPLVGTFFYEMNGGPNDRLALLLYFMSYTALGGIFYGATRIFLSQKISLLFTFLLLSTQNIIRHGGRYEAGQGDLTVGLYIFTSCAILYQFTKDKSPKTLLLFLILLAMTAQIKSDALPAIFLMVLLSFIFIIKNKLFSLIPFIATTPLLLLPWELFKMSNHLPRHLLFRQGFFFEPDRALIALTIMIKEFFNFQNWSLLWIVLIIVVFLRFKKLKSIWIFALILFLQWAAYFIVFLITPVDPTLHASNIINKLYLHIAPLAVFLIAFLTFNGSKKRGN